MALLIIRYQGCRMQDVENNTAIFLQALQCQCHAATAAAAAHNVSTAE